MTYCYVLGLVGISFFSFFSCHMISLVTWLFPITWPLLGHQCAVSLLFSFAIVPSSPLENKVFKPFFRQPATTTTGKIVGIFPRFHCSHVNISVWFALLTNDHPPRPGKIVGIIPRFHCSRGNVLFLKLRRELTNHQLPQLGKTMGTFPWYPWFRCNGMLYRKLVCITPWNKHSSPWIKGCYSKWLQCCTSTWRELGHAIWSDGPLRQVLSCYCSPN